MWTCAAYWTKTLGLREYDMKVNNIALEREIPEDLPSVVGDPHQLEQVFLNIINNALDAMIDGGGKRLLKITIAKKDAFVCVEFADTGPGIKGINRIFDPFYTTKSIGKGTGLGLSICYGIVKEHNGDIIARNREEGGAALEVRLPASEKASVVEPVNTVRRKAALAGRILLVEDEEAVLEFEREVLIGAGADVITAATVDGMKEHLREDAFDVIVMNGRMPGSGSVREMYRRIAADHAGMEQKLLLTFASVTDAETRAFLHGHDVQSLAKPFEVADLIAQVRSVMQKQNKSALPAEAVKSLSAGAGS